MMKIVIDKATESRLFTCRQQQKSWVWRSAYMQNVEANVIVSIKVHINLIVLKNKYVEQIQLTVRSK